MAHGAVLDDQGVWPNLANPWNHNFIHRDIKLSNYFLKSFSGLKAWPGLPVATLGDFGNGVDMAEPYYTGSPWAACGMGTPGWEAPEQLRSQFLFPVSSRTNIYQIGLCVLELMALGSPMNQREFSPDQNVPSQDSDNNDEEEDEEDWDIDANEKEGIAKP